MHKPEAAAECDASDPKATWLFFSIRLAHA